MKTINKTYRFRVFPDKEQEVLLNQHFGHSRWVYNRFLNERKEQYQVNKKSDNYYKQAATLTKLKKEEDTIWLKEVNSQTLQFALRSLDTAFLNFFRGNARFPRFKSRKRKNTFTIPQFGTLENDKIFIPKFRGGIKVKLHRDIKGEIGKMNITKTPTGKYYVSIFTEQEIEQLPKTGKQVGIDLGLKDFVITSDNKKFKNNRYTKKYGKKLKKAKQHFSRKEKGSNGFEKQKLRVAGIYEKIAGCRLDTLHKVSKQLVNEYDTIACEDLNVKGMSKRCKPKQDERGKYIPNGQSKKGGLNRSILDASWGNFVTLLQYKCDWYGKELVKVNRFYPSSKTCNKCGWINQGLKLFDREWTCNSCGMVHDRDHNASINILKEGLKTYGQGLSITKVERKLDFGNKAHSVKPETQSIGFAVGAVVHKKIDFNND